MGGKRSDTEDRWSSYEKAEGLYMGGRTLQEVADLCGLPFKRVADWCERYSWDAKRVMIMSSPRGASEFIREMLHRKVAALGAVDELTSVKVEEIGKISKALGAMDAEGLASAGKLEVIRDFAVWVRGKAKGPDEYHVVSLYLQRYLQETVL